MDLIPNFFTMVNPGLFINAAILLFVSFAVWEIPRSFKLMPEYTKGLYPDTGRMIDIGLFVFGLLCVILLFGFGRVNHAIETMRSPGQIILFIVLLIFLPIIVIVRFFKRLFARFDSHNAIGIFTVHTLLDLARHVFFIALAVLGLGVVASFI